jgi:hypothetical protein
MQGARGPIDAATWQLSPVLRQGNILPMATK